MLGPMSFGALASSAGGAAVTYLLRDLFADADGTAITAHTPDIDLGGGGWSESVAGKFDIQSNQLNVKAVGGGQACYVDVGVADFKITATIDTVAGASAATGIAFRFTDSNNFWLARWLISSDVLQLYSRQAGTYTLRDSAVLLGDVGDSYGIEVTTSGTDITVTVNATSLSFSSSFNQSATRVGVDPGGATNDVGTRVDNFDVVNFP